MGCFQVCTITGFCHCQILIFLFIWSWEVETILNEDRVKCYDLLVFSFSWMLVLSPLLDHKPENRDLKRSFPYPSKPLTQFLEGWTIRAHTLYCFIGLGCTKVSWINKGIKKRCSQNIKRLKWSFVEIYPLLFLSYMERILAKRYFSFGSDPSPAAKWISF